MLFQFYSILGNLCYNMNTEAMQIEQTFKFYDIFDNKYNAEQNEEYCYVTINV